MINTITITKGLVIFMTCLLLISCTEETKEDPIASNYVEGLVLNTAKFRGDDDPTPVFKGVYTDAEGGVVEVIIVNRSDYSTEELNVIPLLVIPGGTGGRVEHQISPSELFGHRLGIVVGFRGTSVEHDTVGDCKGDTQFIECLKTHPNLAKYTPQQTALDTIQIIKILAGEESILIDGVARNASSFFATNFRQFDSYTGSYGGTVISYLMAALQEEPDPTTLRRVVVDNVDGPAEKVISQGFEINLAIANRLFNACENNNFCNSTFPYLRTNLPQWMEMHHGGEGVNVNFNSNKYTIHSGDMFDILSEGWERSNGERELIKPTITFISDVIVANMSITEPSTEFPVDVTIDISNLTDEQISEFNRLLNSAINRPLIGGSYATSIIDLNSPIFTEFLYQNGKEEVLAFISRVGLICSPYILRNDMPDSQEIYNAELKKPMLSPWRYGFLISYRAMLDVCPRLVDVIPGLETPSNLNAKVEKALVYYGAMDPKHSLESTQELAANFQNSEVVIEELRGQNGGTFGFSIFSDMTTEFFRTGNINRARVEEANMIGLDRVFPYNPVTTDKGTDGDGTGNMPDDGKVNVGTNNNNLSAVFASSYDFSSYEEGYAEPLLDVVADSDWQLCNTTVDHNNYTDGPDPLIDYQWYLDSAKVKQAWELNDKQGEGIIISIVDTGIDENHEDLAENFLPGKSINVHVNDNGIYRHNINPQYKPYDMCFNFASHGTQSTGIIAARGDNRRGIKGIAHKAKIWGSNLRARAEEEEPEVTNQMLIDTYTHMLNETAISSNSWGDDPESRLLKVSPVFFPLIENGLVNGFNGKGISYVFAGGNSRTVVDVPSSSSSSQTYDELGNHPGLIVVCGVNYAGNVARYSESGAGLWVCGHTNDLPNEYGVYPDQDIPVNITNIVKPEYLRYVGVVSTDGGGLAGVNPIKEDDDDEDERFYSDDGKILIEYNNESMAAPCSEFIYNHRLFDFGAPNALASEGAVNPTCANKTIDISWGAGATNSYTRFSGGTSAAAPLVSGVIGLIRSAYPQLSWRDIKFILAESTDVKILSSLCVGASAYYDRTRKYCHDNDYGFGIVDAEAAMRLAAKWNIVTPPFKKHESATITTPSLTVSTSTDINFIEYVQVFLTSNYTNFGALNVTLTSPLGKVSTFASQHGCVEIVTIIEEVGPGITNTADENNITDYCPDLEDGFTFGSAAHLGEEPEGNWTLNVTDGSDTNVPIEWKMTTYGHRRE